jgi:hypothetical protein
MSNSIILTILAAACDALERDPVLLRRFQRLLVASPATASVRWIPLKDAPFARKTARALAKRGEIPAKLVHGRWYLSEAGIAAFMAKSTPKAATDDDDGLLRAELGLTKKVA